MAVSSVAEPSQATQIIPTTQRTNGIALDGFVKKKSHSKARTAVAPLVKSAQKSQILMRGAVKKPAVATKRQPDSQGPTISKSHLGQSTELVEKAKSIKQSPHISRYGDVQHRTSVVKKVQPLEVKKDTNSSTTLTHETKTAHSDVARQAISAAQTQPHSGRSKATSEHIERALGSATAHEQQPHPAEHTKRRKKFAHKMGISTKAMAISSSVLAGVVLGGFFALQNVPNLSMRVAAARAGFDASMPGYSPSGFSYNGPINYSPGQVTISFSSNTDDRQYNVTERASNWNSDALLSNFVASGNGQYQTYLDRGRTLYIYNGSNATWVDNGVWYQIEGESDMTTDQLVRIAASI